MLWLWHLAQTPHNAAIICVHLPTALASNAPLAPPIPPVPMAWRRCMPLVACGMGNVCVWKRKSVQSLARRFSFCPATHPARTHTHTLWEFFEVVSQAWARDGRCGRGMPVLYIELIKLGTWHQQWNALKSITIWSSLPFPALPIPALSQLG